MRGYAKRGRYIESARARRLHKVLQTFVLRNAINMTTQRLIFFHVTNYAKRKKYKDEEINMNLPELHLPI